MSINNKTDKIEKKAKSDIVKVTLAAQEQMRNLVHERNSQDGEKCLGIRLNVKRGGCSGFKYLIEYADFPVPFEQSVNLGDFTLFIDPKAIMHVIDTEIGYVEDDFHAEFTFTNPNETSKCGCGKSFGTA